MASSQKWKKYKVEGDKVKKGKTCPRCGPGVFLMEADNRLYCGRCHWTEFKSGKKSGEKGSEKSGESKKGKENKEGDKGEESGDKSRNNQDK